MPIVLNANVRSIQNKLDETSITLQQYGADIACFTETWCNDQIPDSALTIDGFSQIRRDRNHKRGGGLLCYIRQTIPITRVWSELDDEQLETIWITLRPHRLPRTFSHITIGLIYHPPGSPNRPMLNHIRKCLDTVLQKHPSTAIFLMGDFNTLPANQLLGSFNLKQIVKTATRKNKILDKIFTNTRDFYKVPDVTSPIGLSDHNTVIVSPDLHQSYNKGENESFQTRSSGRNQKVLFVNELSKVNWTHLYKMKSCNEQYQFFSDTINNLLDEHLPMKTVKRFSTDKPWVTEEFKDLIRQRQLAFRNNDIKKNHFFRNRIVRTSKKLKENYYRSNVANLRQDNPSQWWKRAKNLAHINTSANSISGLANSHCQGDYPQLTNDINTFFQSVSKNLTPLSSPTHSTENDITPDKFIISVQEVEKCLANVKIAKAIGPDQLPNWILHDLPAVIAKPLTSIFNSSIREGFVPQIWKSANVIPIPKISIPKSIQSDLRPISLTPVISKILESFITNWLSEYIVLDDNQYGARKGLSTTHFLIEFVHNLLSKLEPGKDKFFYRVLFLDFSKAFDLIDHNILIQKLKEQKIPDLLVNWISSFLHCRTQRVKIDNFISVPLTLNGGVPQGTLLGPVLFTIMINDLKCSACPNRKYVDDTTVLELCKFEELSSLQTSADEIITWTEKNNMKLNAKKTKTMTINFTRSLPLYSDIIINNQTIDEIDSFKLLGIRIRSDLRWDDHIQHLIKINSLKLHYLRLLKRAKIPFKELLNVYYTIIRSSLEYACPVWTSGLTNDQSSSLEQIQKRALKIIFPTMTYDQALSNNNISTLATRRLLLAKRFFDNVTKYSNPVHNLLHLNTSRRLRSTAKFEIPKVKTDRYKNSFIPFALKNFQ